MSDVIVFKLVQVPKKPLRKTSRSKYDPIIAAFLDSGSECSRVDTDYEETYPHLNLLPGLKTRIVIRGLKGKIIAYKAVDGKVYLERLTDEE